jgi:hypothetical protein
MPKLPLEHIRLRLVYRGGKLPGWRGGPKAFGVQDKADGLHPGAVADDGGVIFELTFEVKADRSLAPVLSGPLAHGPPRERFIYLGWRNGAGGYARRLKLPLGSIGWSDVDAASRAGEPLIGELVDQPRMTTTGAHIGGQRAIVGKRP